MSATSYRETLRSTLQALGLGGRINRTAPLENVDLAVSTPCYQAFFKILEHADTLEDSWGTLQNQIAQYKSEHKDVPRDLYLTFLLMDVIDADHLRIAQAISADPMVCRKIVLYAGERPLVDAIESLPFIGVGAGAAGPAPSVQETFSAFHARGYPAEILEAVSERASVDNILSRILDLQVPSYIPTIEVERVPLSGGEEVRAKASRLKLLTIKDFRGIRQANIDLSANLTVIYGPNGTGKTSVFDAIEWALLGSVERLEAESEDDVSGLSPYLNLFCDSPQAIVSLDMQVTNEGLHITRVGSAAKETVLSVNDRTNSDDRQLLSTITGQEGAKLDLRILRRLIRNTWFLSQSTLKSFLSDDPSQRYWSLSHLLGTQDYMRILDKLQEIRTELDARTAALQEEIDVSNKDVSLIADQIQARRSQLATSSALRDLEATLQKLMQDTAESLRIVASPYTDLFKSVAGYEETQSSVSIAADWIDKELKRQRDEIQRLVAAKDALIRNKDIEGALARTSAEYERIIATRESQTQELNSKVSVRAQRQSELQSLSEQMQRLTKRQSQLREGVVLVGQMNSIRPLLGEQEQQARETERAVQDSVGRKGPLAQELESTTRSQKQAAEQLKRLRTQLTLLDELESSSTTYVQLLQERPSLQEELRSTRQKTIEQEGAKTAALTQIAELREELKSNSYERETKLRSIERFRALVIELQQFLTAADCPLCGHTWNSVEELANAVKERSAWVSPEIRELERLGKELQRRIDVAETALRVSGQDIASLGAKQTDLESRLRSTEEIERSFRHRLEQIGVSASGFTEAVSAITKLRASNDSDIAANTKEIAALDMRVRQLNEMLDSIDSEAANLEDQHNRALSRLTESQRRLNDLTRQFAELDVMLAPDLPALAHELENCVSETTKLAGDRVNLQKDFQVLDTDTQQMRLEVESTNRKEKEYVANIASLRAVLDRARALLVEAELAPHAAEDDVTLRIERANARVVDLNKARASLHEMDQVTSWLISRREIDELTAKLNQMSVKVQGIVRKSDKLKAWHSHLSGLSVTILDAKAKVETLQLAQYGPTINLLYQRLNTHPLFREIKFLIDPVEQSVKINVSFPQISKHLSDVKGLAPTLYLSEAQLNVVALTIFLSHSFQQRWSQFAPLLIDDPVMNLDDFNANGLIDCLRALAENDRQFVVSTCDIGFYRLLLVKLRCMNDNGRTRFRAYRLDGISTSGPTVIQDSPVPRDASVSSSPLVQ